MQNLNKLITSHESYTAIQDYLPSDHSKPQAVHLYLEQFFSQHPENVKVLDLGCGRGDSIDLFRRLAKDFVWYGVDIEDSQAVRQRISERNLMSTFNGVDLPYPENYFDLIYCHQVLEHVRHPDALITDAFRVLKPNGLFMGAVSYMEPYHAYSIFNFTPYGIVKVFSDAGFELKEIRPGVDAYMLITRQLLNRSNVFRPIWNHNFLYGIIELIGSIFGLGHRERNFLKVQFSGHLIFLARRPLE
jgi:ubiquinone/menaquinone biosynthesis C-methylase UbiE